MAMNKKEAAQLSDALELAEVNFSLRWTEAVEKDVPAPKDFSEKTIGWTFNVNNLQINQEWSSMALHGHTSMSKYYASQGAIAMYSTEILALRAMRNEVERNAAKELLKIDRKIKLLRGA